MRPFAAQIFAWSALCAYCVLLAWLSLRTGAAPGGFEGADKLYHALAYGGLMVLMAAALGISRIGLAFVATCLFGILMELAQGWLTEWREPSLLDGLANAVGALLVLCGLAAWRRRR